ncbi:MAG: CDP-glycerol glycerophosphotransferase family protein [Butyrivibrio sp.]|nr:CDP-glycerol glycerophosphotransferase family protein [Butyrivibrio sp.]
MNCKIQLTAVWILKGGDEKNKATLDCLKAQTAAPESVKLVLCPLLSDGQEAGLPDVGGLAYVCETEKGAESRAVLLNRASRHIEGALVTVIEDGDTFGKTYFEEMTAAMRDTSGFGHILGIPAKRCQNTGNPDALSGSAGKGKTAQYIDFERKYDCLPYFAAGTWIAAEYFKEHKFREDLRYEYEKEYFLRAALEAGGTVFDGAQEYVYDEVREDDKVFFAGCYEKEWYYEAIEDFWLVFLEELDSRYKGKLPRIIQYQAMYALTVRTEANLDNQNKHCIPEEETEEYILSWGRMLRFIDDKVIMNAYAQRGCTSNPYIKRMFLRIKYNDGSYDFERYYSKGKVFFGAAGVTAAAQSSQCVNIQFMEYADGRLHIDGTLSGLFDVEKGHFYAEKDGTAYEVKFNRRYSHTKLFGYSIYKRTAFEVDVPIEDTDCQRIGFKYETEGEVCSVVITFDSHTSRLSKRFKSSYWTFGGHFMAMYRKGTISVYKVRKRAVAKREVLLWLEMFKTFNKKTWLFMLMRMAYFIMKPFWKRKPIWMFIDKIYKAGDSSEYLYRYACAQDDGIKKYYLVDKKCPDYRRLKRDGYKPLRRGTIKHRLMFMYADMMIISNSTVFAFNDYSLNSSGHMRDLFNFRTVCVQHGMSVQKIAIAQNRLRDNISLYFCASKYELENLNRPIYDYAGRDILKLTGVPRYDGLINDDKRQILITPTWRMQAAVPVTKNEGVARDYNPLFKESSYYKVYNSLINDERLIDAARKYNYRILYVLHPIVSPQAEDFDRNDYVDIVPATGDMSYEKVFRESSLMVTDYSGVQFDFAYMRKPLVYLHHDDIPQHYEEGTFHYDTMAFGEICRNNDELTDTLIEYMKNDCVMKEQFRKRADDFFEFDDHENCKRIYEVMINYEA